MQLNFMRNSIHVAAGVLAARVGGYGIDRQLLTGAIAAAEIISHFGARPLADLQELVKL